MAFLYIGFLSMTMGIIIIKDRKYKKYIYVSAIACP
jgi:hypothetical protein